MDRTFQPAVASRGVSAVELLVWVALAGLLVVAVSVLLGTGIRSNRFQFEQVLITEDARRQLELMSDALRNARNEGANNWLVAAADNDVTIRTDINQDSQIDQIRYFLDGDDLKRGITEAGGSEVVRTVARSIRNQLAGQNLFTYYNAEREQIDATAATSTTVSRIGIAFLVDIGEAQAPDAGEIVTAVRPRSEETETVRLWPVDLDFPVDPLSIQSDAGTVQVTTTNPTTGGQMISTITLADLNDGRVGTYTGDYYTHLNYQDEPDGPDLPGWYAWVGPITVGQQGTDVHQVNDKFLQAAACAGTSLDQLLTTCTVREVEANGFVQRYLPIFTFTQFSGDIDYIRSITYGGGP